MLNLCSLVFKGNLQWMYGVFSLFSGANIEAVEHWFK